MKAQNLNKIKRENIMGIESDLVKEVVYFVG